MQAPHDVFHGTLLANSSSGCLVCRAAPQGRVDAIEVSESSDGHGRSVNLFGAQKVVLLSVYLPASVGEVIRVRGAPVDYAVQARVGGSSARNEGRTTTTTSHLFSLG